ncbi:acyltransferase family protein [Novosphingobium sp. RD2P27]|uniref:Acyltransferase family protein n=1 Tax=Novosphingobium kalidii TaxID=3230299 RepID=A0ABV2CWC5_9SPHN
MPEVKSHRSQWVDIAKAISILLVVFHHSSFSFTPAMMTLDEVLLFFRMPLFFFASGLFLSKMMRYDFPALVGRRLAPLLYLYVIWSVVKWAAVTGLPYLRGQEVDLANVLHIFWEPPATLWFIYALALYSLFAWLLRKLPVAFVAAAAFVASALALSVGPVTDGPFALRIARFFLWFWLGYALRDHTAALIKQHFRWPLLLVVPLWGWTCYHLSTSGADLHIWALPLTASALLAGLVLAGALERTSLSRPLAALGRNTLPIYVAHFFPLMLLSGQFASQFLAPSWFAALFSMILAVTFSYAAKLIADQVGLGWIYELPQSAREGIELRMGGMKRRATKITDAGGLESKS